MRRGFFVLAFFPVALNVLTQFLARAAQSMIPHEHAQQSSSPRRSQRFRDKLRGVSSGSIITNIRSSFNRVKKGTSSSLITSRATFGRTASSASVGSAKSSVWSRRSSVCSSTSSLGSTTCSNQSLNMQSGSVPGTPTSDVPNTGRFSLERRAREVSGGRGAAVAMLAADPVDDMGAPRKLPQPLDWSEYEFCSGRARVDSNSDDEYDLMWFDGSRSPRLIRKRDLSPPHATRDSETPRGNMFVAEKQGKPAHRWTVNCLEPTFWCSWC